MASFFVNGREWFYETDKKYSSHTGRIIPKGYHLPSLEEARNLLGCIDSLNMILQEILCRGSIIWVQETGEVPFQVILNNELTRQEKRPYNEIMPIYIKNDENWLVNHQDTVRQRIDTIKNSEERTLHKNEKPKSNEKLKSAEFSREIDRVQQMLKEGHSLSFGGCGEIFVSDHEEGYIGGDGRIGDEEAVKSRENID